MSNRPARITQAEIERAIRAAKKAGATEIEVKIGDGVSIRGIPLTPNKPVADSRGDCPLMDGMPRPRPPHLHQQVYASRQDRLVRPRRQGPSHPHPQRLRHPGVRLRVPGRNSRIAGPPDAQG